MKAFSKEWWLEKAIEAEHRYANNDWVDNGFIAIANYCFKRYAEAYHREKMMFTESLLMTMHKKGQEAERKKILRLIEGEEKNIAFRVAKNTDRPWIKEQAALDAIGYLTQKIKSE